MVRYIFVVIAILLAINIISANNSERINIWFVGYDGQIPVFRSSKCIENGRTCFWDSTIYKYVGGQLMKMGFHAPSGACLSSGTKLWFVKDSIYVFRENTGREMVRYYFKLNGKVITSIDISFNDSREARDPDVHAMNGEYFFIIGETDRSGGSTILRFNYHTPADVDTFKIKEFYPQLLGASNNYLYFVDQDPEETGPAGHLYQMDINTGVTQMILENTGGMTEYMAMAISLNLFYNGETVYNYNERLYAIFSDVDISNGIFFSYEDNAFIITGHEMDTDKWHILRLDDLTEWKPY
jgi:hypothetical protein